MNRQSITLLAIAHLACICGCSSGVEPSGSLPGVAGAWVANSTLTEATGGDCVGSTIRSAADARDVVLAALQPQSSGLSATITSQGDGTTCAYTGSVAGDAVSLMLTTCAAARVSGVRCAGGALRDVQLVSGTISANLQDRTSGTGTAVTTWSVATPEGASLGTLRISATSTWRFLGIPSSDYHVFTGTVFPGYADGTISIEGTDSFCHPCGWFPR